jgi:hypothetical protein
VSKIHFIQQRRRDVQNWLANSGWYWLLWVERIYRDVNGQTVVLLLLVAQSVTFPVGFAFYRPDPMLTAWGKEDKRLKKEGVAKKDRPVQPARNGLYPTKTQLALRLLQAFKDATALLKSTRF